MWPRRKISPDLIEARKQREISEIRLGRSQQILADIHQIRRVNHIADELEDLILTQARKQAHDHPVRN
jgi:hypothetical protein